MPTTLITYITYRELNSGTPATLELFHKYLGRYEKNKVVHACSAINSLLKPWQRAEWDVHEALIRESFPPDLANKLLAKCREGTSIRLVFHRLQMIFVTKEAIKHCKEEGIDPGTQQYWGGLGIAFLMANDLLHYDLPTPANETDRKKQTLTQLVPVGEYSGRHWLKENISRAYLLLTRFSKSLRGTPDFIDLENRFENITRLTFDEYYALGIGVLSHYMTMDLATLKRDPTSLLISRTFFQNTPLETSKANRFLGEISSDAPSYARAFKKRDQGTTDFTWFRERPLFAHGDNFYAIDTVFLSDKLDNGVFWRVHNALPSDAEKQKLHRFWGATFEKYVNWVLSESIDNSLNTFYVSPCFEDTGDQVCDAIIVCGYEAAFLEYKGSTFTAKAKYSGHVDFLAREIDEKLVGSDGNKKGVFQLADAIGQVFRRSSPRKIRGLDLSKTVVVYPVLITRDSVGGSLLLSWYLNSHFQRKVNKRSIRPHIATPLFCLSVQGVEELSAYLRDAAITRLLNAWYENDPALLSTFLAVENSAIREIGARNNTPLTKAFDELWDEATERLFPGRKAAPLDT